MGPEMILLVTVCLLTAVVTILFIILVVLYLTSSPYADLTRLESEYFFTSARKDEALVACPSIDDPASVELSVIVPAYNEESRLPKMLDDAIEYLESKFKADGDKASYEIIVVDDGSSDRTTQTALSYANRLGPEKLRVLTLRQNRGKGGAVRIGMLSARGRMMLFADADGAARFKDVQKLIDQLRKLQRSQGTNLVLICGSRAHLERESIAKRSYFRTFLMLGFHFLVSSLYVNHIRDTQCGFKLFTRPAAKLLFTNMHVERWAFDVDLLYVANHFGVATGEVPVTWCEIDGSKMVPVFSWLQMAKDLLLIRLRYTLGVWKLERKHKVEKVE